MMRITTNAEAGQAACYLKGKIKGGEEETPEIGPWRIPDSPGSVRGNAAASNR